MKRAAILTLAALATGAASAGETHEQIGSWTLTCPAGDPCLLRLTKRFADKAGITSDLEVQALGTTLVPVITLRGLPPEVLLGAAMAGKADASLLFNNAPRGELVCSTTPTVLICAPAGDAARHLADALPSARSVIVRATVTASGMKPFPVEEKSLDLSGTAAALSRLQTAGPTHLPLFSFTPPGNTAPPSSFMAMADKVLKQAGYLNGLGDLQALIAKYRGK
jgi:hypothetical protein